MIDRGAGQASTHAFKRWLFAGLEVKGTQGPHPEEKEIEHPWWKVMCLTGVDYFSTLALGDARARDIDSLWSAAYLPPRGQ